MLSSHLRWIILLAILLYFILLFFLLKKRKLSLRYSLLWLFSGVVMLVFTLIPQLLDIVSSLTGFEVQSNALFAILFFCMLIILVALTSINSKQSESIKRLVQKTALLEKRIQELEELLVQKKEEA